jgi:hypothetical protein
VFTSNTKYTTDTKQARERLLAMSLELARSGRAEEGSVIHHIVHDLLVQNTPKHIAPPQGLVFTREDEDAAADEWMQDQTVPQQVVADKHGLGHGGRVSEAVKRNTNTQVPLKPEFNW